jgi:hypothetical protein
MNFHARAESFDELAPGLLKTRFRPGRKMQPASFDRKDAGRGQADPLGSACDQDCPPAEFKIHIIAPLQPVGALGGATRLLIDQRCGDIALRAPDVQVVGRYLVMFGFECW